MSTGLTSLTISIPAPLPDADVLAASTLLEEEAVSVSWEKITDEGQDIGWTLTWVLYTLPDTEDLARSLSAILDYPLSADSFETEEIPDINWLEESYRSFPAFTVGPFYIYGSHWTETPPAELIPLQIDAATAFGSGEHGTTRGCLEALAHLHETGFKPSRILDMGSGSGILAIAAWKLWAVPVLAVDIDPEATIVADRHREINAIPTGETGMTCVTGDGYQAEEVTTRNGSFDLVIANILAGPLKVMAADLDRALAGGGYAILSGLLREQEESVMDSHTPLGLSVAESFPHQEWQALLLRK